MNKVYNIIKILLLIVCLSLIGYCTDRLKQRSNNVVEEDSCVCGVYVPNDSLEIDVVDRDDVISGHWSFITGCSYDD